LKQKVAMSYDLVFWRGNSAEKPSDVLQKLSRLEIVDGLEVLDKEEVINAFRSTFGQDLKVELAADGGDEYIHGWLFSFQLYKPLSCLWVTCGWKVLEQPQVLQKLTIAGYCRLGCNMYNPQIDEFVAGDSARA
jgi:hypothetical protein